MSWNWSRSRRSTKNRGEPASHLAAGQQAQTWICARNYPQFSSLIATEWPVVHPLKKAQRRFGYPGHRPGRGCGLRLLTRTVAVESTGWFGFGWLGSQLPLARARKDSLKSASHSDPPQFFSLPPNTSHPPSAQIYFLSTPPFSLFLLSSSISPQSFLLV